MDTCATLEEYFYQKISESSLDGDLQAYLVLSLAKWAKAVPNESEPLAIAYMQAIHRRGWSLREVADRALYWAGVVPHSLGPLVSRRYVEEVGKSAYGFFAEQTKARVFWLLSENFQEVSEAAYAACRPSESEQDVVERYQRTRDERDAAYLRSRGVLVLR